MRSVIEFLVMMLEMAGAGYIVFSFYQRSVLAGELREAQAELRLARNKLEAQGAIRAIS